MAKQFGIEKYNTEYPNQYEAERKIIIDAIGDEVIEIQHIGSSAVPGLSGKPIIDIAVLVDSAEKAESLVKKLGEIGYELDMEAFSSERHFFRKYGEKNFHLSLAYANQGSFWHRQIIFRDILLTNDEARQKYDALKLKLISDDPSGGKDYIEGKSAFINQMLNI
jgi:GrpB-like predicted nucleotidyltransferase (UPF0157 family)